MPNVNSEQTIEIYFANAKPFTDDTPMCRTFDSVSFECVFEALSRRYLHVTAYSQRSEIVREYNNG